LIQLHAFENPAKNIGPVLTVLFNNEKYFKSNYTFRIQFTEKKKNISRRWRGVIPLGRAATERACMFLTRERHLQKDGCLNPFVSLHGIKLKLNKMHSNGYFFRSGFPTVKFFTCKSFDFSVSADKRDYHNTNVHYIIYRAFNEHLTNAITFVLFDMLRFCFVLLFSQIIYTCFRSIIDIFEI